MVSPTSEVLHGEPRTRPAKQLKSNAKKRTQTASRSSGRTTKHDRVLGLLQTKGGTTIAAVSKTLARLDQRRFAPPPGTVLVREWDRKSHRVMVMPDGFAWNGETFDSLSEIAFTITGTKWNGPRFFGLRDRRPHINGGEPE